MIRAAALAPPLARTPAEWAQALRPLGGRPFHARQVFRWLHVRGVLDPEQMTDLPKRLRAELAPLELPHTLKLADERRAADATRKLLVRLRDGATVETVLIPRVSRGTSSLASPLATPEQDAYRMLERSERADAMETAYRMLERSERADAMETASAVDDDDEDDPNGDAIGAEPVPVTQCVSTQVGCAMGCGFCASGVAGLKRNLGADEIVAQVLLGRSRLDPTERLRSVVFMGMGEPLHNYDATRRALQLLTHPDGIGLSARRITVSTSGLVPEIARLGADFGGNIGLAVSIHAADDETRSRLMPINKKYPLASLMSALRAYPLPRRRRITIEYTLVAGYNDRRRDASGLGDLLRGIPVKVNLIPMNPIAASPLGPPPLSRVLDFQKFLCSAGYSCFIRRRRGDDVSAACGQLVLLGASPKVRVNRG
jgi:23S rRNA (adenine2503-C2)-methyltransferase